uniref:Uncharacterized protein n=1 Tax=Panagrolaimus superbus TaxID=310955 RepID=A0A914YWN9_9BILA
MSNSIQSTKEAVKQNLKIALSLLVSSNEFIPVSKVVKQHDKFCNVSFDVIIYEGNFQSYSEVFECFPHEFIISEDRQNVAFKRRHSPTLPALAYTHIVGICSNLKKRAWLSSIYVRKLATNEVIHEPLRAMNFSEIAIPQQILYIKKMNVFRLTCIQQYILPYIFSCTTDIAIEGTKYTGRSVGVIASLLSQIHMYKKASRIKKRGPIAVILLQSSPYQLNNTDNNASTNYANYISKLLRLISEYLDIKIGFDLIETSKDLCVITFKGIREYEKKTLSDLKFFVVFNVEKIIAKVGLEIFAARIKPFVPEWAISIFVMEEYIDPGPILLRDCLKPDAIFISDKS